MTKGSNLFHSFGVFGLNKGETATFTGPGTIKNVIGRVIGGSPSSIDGGIKSTISGANLFLINPSGIVFGPNATVNVSGSFHASSADYVKLSDGAKFQATNPNDTSTLTTAPPAAFGFLNATPGAITVNGLNPASPNPTLLNQGKTLSLIGGPVTINGNSNLLVPSGTIHVTSAAGPGEVPVDPANTAALTVANLGSVNISGPYTNLSISDKAGKTSGGSIRANAGTLTIADGAGLDATNYGSGPGGLISLRGDSQINLSNGATIHSIGTAAGRGGDVILKTAPGGSITASGPGNVNVDVGTGIDDSGVPTGGSGSLTVNTGTLTLSGGAIFGSIVRGSGLTGPISVSADSIMLDGRAPKSLAGLTGIRSLTFGTANAADIAVNTGQLMILANGEIVTNTRGAGNAGRVSVTASRALSIDANSATFSTGIGSVVSPNANGNAGDMTISAASLSIAGSPGPLLPSPDAPNAFAGLSAQTLGLGNGGTIALNVGGAPLTISNGGVISAITGAADGTGSATGKGGSLNITALGPLQLTDPRTAITTSALAASTGDAGTVTISAPQITLASGAQIASTTAGPGNGGPVSVTTAGALTIDGQGVAQTQIASSAIGAASGMGGTVTVNADSLRLQGGGRIASTAGGAGRAGDIGLTIGHDATLAGAALDETPSAITTAALPRSTGVAGVVGLSVGGALNLSSGAQISSSTAGKGDAGTVSVTSLGALSLSGVGTKITTAALDGSSGNAGSISVWAPQIALASGAQIVSTTGGTGSGGPVTVSTGGALTVDGQGVTQRTQIASSATNTISGAGGAVTVTADSLTLQGGGLIASTAGGLGRGGDIGVTITHNANLSGVASDGIPSAITASAKAGSIGEAGAVELSVGGALNLSGGAQISSSTGGRGDGGRVTVASLGALSLGGVGTAITTAALEGSNGNAGSVAVNASQIAVRPGAQIASTTAGNGAGGPVTVTAGGALTIDGAGAQIAASATGPNSGAGGAVTVSAATLSVTGAGRIASTTAGPGNGGDITVTTGGNISLSGAGPQITASSSGSGDAGAILVSAPNLKMTGGAAISTEADTANGGNITLRVADFLYLINSRITTSVHADRGNGGNITIDPKLLVLDNSQIIAQAVLGHGGNITIVADEFLRSTDSVVSASSELGISGTVELIGPRVDLNGSLVVLSSELRNAAAIFRDSCAARGNRPRSSLTEGGRGGLPQDPEAMLLALHVADRDVAPELGAAAPHHAAVRTAPAMSLTPVQLAMHCR